MKSLILSLFLMPIILYGQKGVLTNFSLGLSSLKSTKYAPIFGTSMASSFEYQFNKKLTIWADAEFINYGFTVKESIYTLKDKISLIPLTAGIYYHVNQHRFNNYLIAGLGFSFLSIPKLKIEDVNHIIEIDKQTSLLLPSMKIGYGMQWAYKPMFIPFVEVKYYYHFGENIILGKNISSFNLNLGIRSKFF
jgi:hypothetical protein